MVWRPSSGIMRPCFSRYSQLQGNSSHLNSMPNLRPAASRTRTPSGTTSLPIPSPGITAILQRFILLRSEPDVASALELQHLTRVVGRGDGQAELFEDPADLGHLLRVRLRQ